MITTDVQFHTFWQWLQREDGSYKNNFTYNGAEALFNYLDELSDEMGENMEYDPIAWCVEYSEYPSAWDAMQEYQPDDMPVEGEDGDDLLEVQEKNEAKALEWLQDNTTVIEFDGGVIIADF